MTGPVLPRASRRATLGGVVVALTAAGCEAAPPPSEPPEAAPTTPAPSPSDPAEEPDAVLVDGVVEELTSALALVVGASRSRRGLAGELAPWRLLHGAHLEALEGDADGIRPPRVRGAAPALRATVRNRETALQRSLAQASVEARSGALAALLATMSAAVAQQLAAPRAGTNP